MTGKKRLEFTGKGFSQDEFSPDERAEMRERNYTLDSNFLTAEAFLKETGLVWVAKMANGVPAFLKMFTAASIIAGGITAAKAMGWL